MRVFVAGATGTLGVPVVRALVRDGHEVVGLTRRPGRAAALSALGARPVIGDALDAGGLARAVAEAAPTHVVHLLTAIPPGGALRAFQMKPTNRLRVEGTANLVAAARGAGARRVVAESFFAVYGTVRPARPLDEDDSFGPAKGALAATIAALRTLETTLADARRDGLETVALRCGGFYGSDVPSVRGLIELLRARKMALPPARGGSLSWVHPDDAAEAVLAALRAGAPGPVYNVADNAPLAAGEFVEALAAAIGAPAPRVLPRWVFRLVAPVAEAAGGLDLPLSNARARRDLGWSPRRSVAAFLEDLRRQASGGALASPY